MSVTFVPRIHGSTSGTMRVDGYKSVVERYAPVLYVRTQEEANNFRTSPFADWSLELVKIHLYAKLHGTPEEQARVRRFFPPSPLG